MPEYFYGDRLFTSLERTEPDSGMLLVCLLYTSDAADDVAGV